MLKRLKSDHECCWYCCPVLADVGVTRGCRGCRDKAWVIRQCFDSPDHSKHDEGVGSYVRYITCRDNVLNRCLVKLGRHTLNL